jgi:hypothetical protein
MEWTFSVAPYPCLEGTLQPTPQHMSCSCCLHHWHRQVSKESLQVFKATPFLVPALHAFRKTGDRLLHLFRVWPPFENFPILVAATRIQILILLDQRWLDCFVSVRSTKLCYAGRLTFGIQLLILESMSIYLLVLGMLILVCTGYLHSMSQHALLPYEHIQCLCTSQYIPGHNLSYSHVQVYRILGFQKSNLEQVHTDCFSSICCNKSVYHCLWKVILESYRHVFFLYIADVLGHASISKCKWECTLMYICAVCTQMESAHN